MTWGTPVLGSQLTTLRVGVVEAEIATTGVHVTAVTAPTLEQLLESPFTRNLLELSPDNTLAAVGTSPDFSMLPKWRKVVRTIG